MRTRKYSDQKVLVCHTAASVPERQQNAFDVQLRGGKPENGMEYGREKLKGRNVFIEIDREND